MTKWKEYVVMFVGILGVTVAEQGESAMTGNYRLSFPMQLDMLPRQRKTFNQCLQSCRMWSACKSLAYQTRFSKCHLYKVNSTTNPYDIIWDPFWSYTDSWSQLNTRQSCLHCPDVGPCSSAQEWCVKILEHCDNGWAKGTRYRYRLYADPMDYEVAKDLCNSEASVLLYLEDEGELSEINDLFRSDLGIDGAWTGGVDFYVDGEWLWETRGNKSISESGNIWHQGHDTFSFADGPNAAILEIDGFYRLSRVALNSTVKRMYICKKAHAITVL